MCKCKILQECVKIPVIRRWPVTAGTGAGRSRDRDSGASAGSYLFVEGSQLSVLPQRVQHLSGCLHHLHGVPARCQSHHHDLLVLIKDMQTWLCFPTLSPVLC